MYHLAVYGHYLLHPYVILFHNERPCTVWSNHG